MENKNNNVWVRWHGGIFSPKKFPRATVPHTPSRSRGFTLVEMVIYIAFFAIFSVLAIEATLMMMRSFYTVRLSESVDQSATTALERMSREVRNAYDIDLAQSTLGTNPGRLMLNTKDINGANTTMEFYVDASSKLHLREGGVEKGLLTTNNVVVNNLVFSFITTPNSKAVKIEMRLQEVRAGLTRSAVFYDTMVLRGSMH